MNSEKMSDSDRNQKDAAISRLTPETKLRLFSLLDLETCLPLSQTCRSFFDFWKAVDGSLIRQKVLQRVPWLRLNELGTELTSWDTCARVMVSRTKRSLSTSSKWLVIDDIRAAMETPSKEHRCAPWEFTDERHESDTPIFADVEFSVDRKTSVKGTTMKREGVEVDLRSLETRSCKEDKKTDATKSLEEEEPKSALPEIYLMDDSSTNIKILSENNNLLLVSINDQSEYLEQECLIHKDMCLKDDKGNYIVEDESLLTVIRPRRGYGVTYTTLLPGDMGAIMLKSITAHDKEIIVKWEAYQYGQKCCMDVYQGLTQEIYVPESDYFQVNYDEDVLIDADLETGFKSCLTYVEPTPDLRHVILCYLPTLACDYDNGSTFLFYNGYLFFYFEGLFIQLWVDMGYQRLLQLGESRQILGHHEVAAQKYDTQALTACNTSFPVMPVNQELVEVDAQQEILQRERYMAIWGCCTYEFYDLLTGETYSNIEPRLLHFIIVPGPPQLVPGLFVPFVTSKGAAGFAYVGNVLLKVLVEELRDLSLLDEEDRYVNLLDFYEIPASPLKSSSLSPSSGIIATINKVKKVKWTNMSYANPKEYRSTEALLRRVKSHLPVVYDVVDIDALLATPYTYALQPTRDHRLDHRLDRSRQRDLAYHRGEIYTKWRSPYEREYIESEFENEYDSDCEMEFDYTKAERAMAAYLEEFPDTQYGGPLAYKSCLW